MNNFLEWRYQGKYSPRGECFDVGVTVCGALALYKKSDHPSPAVRTQCLPAMEGLTRIAPALIAARTKEEANILREKARVLLMERKKLCCTVKYLQKKFAGRLLPQYARYRLPLDTDRKNILSGSYVKETYQSAWWAYQTTQNFEECIIEAINLGDDADTTGAVAGMIAGRMYGFDAIPTWMVEGLQWSEHLIEVAAQLMPCRS